MTDEQPVVKVTLATIYDKLLEVDKKVDPIPATVADHEKRIRAIETRVWSAIGAVGLMAIISPFVSQLVFK